MSDLVKRLHVTAARLEEWVQRYTGIKKRSTEARLMLEAAARIEALEARIAKADALADALENPVRSDDGFYDYLQHDIDPALAAYREGSDT